MRETNCLPSLWKPEIDLGLRSFCGISSQKVDEKNDVAKNGKPSQEYLQQLKISKPKENIKTFIGPISKINLNPIQASDKVQIFTFFFY